jgi:hypothetical protein
VPVREKPAAMTWRLREPSDGLDGLFPIFLLSCEKCFVVSRVSETRLFEGFTKLRWRGHENIHTTSDYS